jgi:hypothetical protein
MRHFILKRIIGVLTPVFLGLSVTGQSVPKMPLMFYPSEKSIFYSIFCKNYQCTFNHIEKDKDGALEELGFLDVTYTGILNIETNRSKIGTLNWWYTGIDLLIDPKYHYNRFYVDVAKKYLNPDAQQIMSELLFLAVGKKYSKEQLLKCMNANKKMNRSYYLDEFLKFPASAPITRVSSGQGVPLYLKIQCGIDEKTIFSISLEP